MRGLNNPAKRDAVREFVTTVRANVVCLQETKLDVIDRYSVMQCLGPSFDSLAYLPTAETRGGVVLAWDSSVVDVDQFQWDTDFITGMVHTKAGASWWLSVVYAPQGDALKTSFLEELNAQREFCSGPWMILGDFNMILRASEKNNTNLNRSTMGKFRTFVDNNELKEVYMNGRRFTWSNERDTPTMTKIDRVLVSVDWELENPDCLLQALSSGVSNHAPLHLHTAAMFYPKKRFRFELCWTKLEGFDDAVREAWVCDYGIVDPFKHLDALLRNTAVALQAWSQRKTGNIKILMAVATMVIFCLDHAQENRILTDQELWLKRTLKLALLGMASLEWTIERQRSRMRWIRKGDANTKLFQAFANGRRAKNFIPRVRIGNEVVTEQRQKEEAFTSAFETLLGADQARDVTLDLDYLDVQPIDLQELEAIFTEQEVLDAIKELHPDRAPGPDGFVGAFYQRA